MPNPLLTGSRVSQPDAVLLGYPLQVPMSREIRLNDLIHYDQVSLCTCISMFLGCFFIHFNVELAVSAFNQSINQSINF